MWKPGTFKPIDISNQITQTFENTFNNINTNGGTIVKCFQVTNNQVIKELPWKQEKFENYFKELLSSPDIVNSLKMLDINVPLENDIGLTESNSLTLDGYFAVRLMWGGAYGEFNGTAGEAKKLGQMFCNYIFQDRYADVKVYSTPVAWTNWFHDVAWDDTWIIFDTSKLLLWIICMTDTD